MLFARATVRVSSSREAAFMLVPHGGLGPLTIRFSIIETLTRYFRLITMVTILDRVLDCKAMRTNRKTHNMKCTESPETEERSQIQWQREVLHIHRTRHTRGRHRTSGAIEKTDSCR